MEKYEILRSIGQGGQGMVHKARDRVRNIMVAVKEIEFPIEEGVPSNIIREISLLKEMNHQNIVWLWDVVPNENRVNLIFEYMDFDLKESMKVEPLVRWGRVSHRIKMLLHEILSGLAYCHSHEIIHRDLKPQNLLINMGSSEVRIADFGAARPIEPTVTLCYAAPELHLGSKHYSAAVDVWSVGCVFAEMVRGRPLFEVSSSMDIFPRIFRIMGTPTEETWPGVTSLCYFPHHLCRHEAQKLANVVPRLEEAGIDLLSRMLCMDPSRRITAREALQHEYFNDV